MVAVIERLAATDGHARLGLSVSVGSGSWVIRGAALFEERGLVVIVDERDSLDALLPS